MTKDLAYSIYGKNMKREHYVNTFEFLDHVKNLALKKYQSKTKAHL